MQLTKGIAITIAALTATSSLVCGQGESAPQLSNRHGFANLGRAGMSMPVARSVGGPAPHSLRDSPLPKQFTQIDFPGATFTAVESANPKGSIIGIYGYSDGSTHGFLLSNGAFTTVDAPGATDTFAFTINWQGD